MHILPFKERIVYCLIVMLFCFSVAQTAVAHGEGQTVELATVPVGPYFLSVYSSPGVLRVGEIHISSLVTDAAQRPVTDCDVLVTMARQSAASGAAALPARPPAAGTNYLHEIEFDVMENGRYQVTVTVVDPAGSGGDASFTIDVIQTPLWIRLPLLFGAAWTFFFGLLLLKQALHALGLWRPQPSPGRAGAAPISRPKK